MRSLALILMLALLASGCKSPRGKKAWSSTQPKDRRTSFAGVSILIPAGVAWWRGKGSRFMSAAWDDDAEPWVDVGPIPGYGESAKGDRKRIEGYWKKYMARLKAANPGTKIPAASWSKLGDNPFLSTRFTARSGIDTRGGYLVVGERVVMLVIQYPKRGTEIDPAALTALERFTISIQPLENTDLYK